VSIFENTFLEFLHLVDLQLLHFEHRWLILGARLEDLWSYLHNDISCHDGCGGRLNLKSIHGLSFRLEEVALNFLVTFFDIFEDLNDPEDFLVIFL